jgi:REP element-mobilizing transposase RayT
MTAPRQVLPGTTYLVTRRCLSRQLFLRPSTTVNQILLYLLAVAAERYGVEVHAYCFLSNHYHLVVTDPDGRLPAFQQFLDALAARAINAHLGRWETLWAPDSYSAVTLPSPADVVAKAAYVLANPVDAGLVAAGSAWPGLWSAPERVGGAAFRVKRPEGFFAPDGTMPEEAALRLTTPRGFDSAERFKDELARTLAEREEKARALRRGRGGFLGRARVLAQKAMTRPRGVEPRRNLNPRVAGRDRWKRQEVIGRLVEFLESYRDAWARRRAGESEVVFPCGTYLMRVLHAVPCAGAG